ncbi:hypothetical protein VTN00DRAFT_353 [Thermoascus crustaceus]|uniref:uncharacterized protein n=1 Tax=Thermoascus crustaceus TaxID=5088 RepID=UPI003742F7F0
MLPIFLVSLLCMSSAQGQDLRGVVTLPSNNSIDLSGTRSLRFTLESRQVHLPSVIDVAPLTQSLSLYQNDLTLFNLTGKLVNVNASNSASLNGTEIAFISCDTSAYPGELRAGETVENVINAHPTAVAILLYSTESNHCNYTPKDPSLLRYPNVFTLLQPDSKLHISDQLRSSNGSDCTRIVPDMSTVSNNSPLPNVVNVPSGSPNNAMIILYSITGIITALFLCIIITGAIRAHRNPDRYGPRNVIGQPRQSRARGLARAMLETIPIVKFGDPYDPKAEAVKEDVEMASTTDGNVAFGSPEGRKSTSADDKAVQTTETGRDGSSTEHGNSSSHEAVPAASRSSTHEQQQPQESANYVCPICTDDFVKGQDLRVLPCNHQFHPECIDPWLVNVSGTCPLCRIDLNPPETDDEDEDSESDDHVARPVGRQETDQINDSANTRHRRGLSTYLHDTLNVRRMRDATVEERIAALRSVRQANQDSSNAGENAETQRRRSRLASRLRDRFRIRTRQHGQPQPHPPASES